MIRIHILGLTYGLLNSCIIVKTLEAAFGVESGTMHIIIHYSIKNRTECVNLGERAASGTEPREEPFSLKLVSCTGPCHRQASPDGQGLPMTHIVQIGGPLGQLSTP